MQTLSWCIVATLAFIAKSQNAPWEDCLLKVRKDALDVCFDEIHVPHPRPKRASHAQMCECWTDALLAITPEACANCGQRNKTLCRALPETGTGFEDYQVTCLPDKETAPKLKKEVSCTDDDACLAQEWGAGSQCSQAAADCEFDRRAQRCCPTTCNSCPTCDLCRGAKVKDEVKLASAVATSNREYTCKDLVHYLLTDSIPTHEDCHYVQETYHQLCCEGFVAYGLASTKTEGMTTTMAVAGAVVTMVACIYVIVINRRSTLFGTRPLLA